MQNRTDGGRAATLSRHRNRAMGAWMRHGPGGSAEKDKTNNTDLRPRIGSPHVLNLVEPTVQEEIAHRLDLVYRLLTCQLQIETDIPVSRIQQQSPLVIQDGRGNLVLLIIGIP